MTTNDQLPDPQSLGYEEARDELVRILGGALFPDPGWSPGASFWTRHHALHRSALI